MAEQTTNIQELISQLRTFQTVEQEELDRLRARLEELDGMSRELYDRLARDNNDYEARRKLERVEEEIRDKSARLKRDEAAMRDKLVQIRQQILLMRNDKLMEIEQRSKAMRRRREEIHAQLLPEALARVEALQEEESRLSLNIEILAAQIHELNQIELPATHSSPGSRGNEGRSGEVA